MSVPSAELLDHFIDVIVPFVATPSTVWTNAGGGAADRSGNWLDRSLAVRLPRHRSCGEWLQDIQADVSALVSENAKLVSPDVFALWRRGGLSPSHNLMPFVATSLGMDSTGAPADPIGGRIVELTPEGRAFASGHLGGRAEGWQLILRNDARRRLGINSLTGGRLSLDLQLAYAFWFPTGIGLLVLRVKWDSNGEDLPRAAALLEIASALRHAVRRKGENLTWRPREASGASKPPDNDALASFSLRALVGALVKTVGGSFEELSDHRFIFVAAHVRGLSREQLSGQEYAYRLARQYTLAYRVPGNTRHSLQTFESIWHGIESEGGSALLAEPDDADVPAASFYKQFVTQAVATAYAPICWLAIHEQVATVRVNDRAAGFLDDRQTEDANFHRLADLRSAFARFRLNYRTSRVSSVGHHNDVFRCWRQALDIDRMGDEIAADLEVGVSRLAELREDRKERRYAWVAILVGIAAVLVGAMEIGNIAFKVLFEHERQKIMARAWIQDSALLDYYLQVLHWERSATLVLAVSALVVGGLGIWLLRRSGIVRVSGIHG